MFISLWNSLRLTSESRCRSRPPRDSCRADASATCPLDPAVWAHPPDPLPLVLNYRLFFRSQPPSC
eukprot:3222786-Pyramimonas_sp.AAC.1